MTEVSADWPIRGRDTPPLVRVNTWGHYWHCRHDTLLTWDTGERRLSDDPVSSHSRDKSSCEERIWEIWESWQEQRSRNMWKTTAQLRYHYYGVKVVSVTLVLSWPIVSIAAYSHWRYLHFFTSKIPVSALCSYSETNISPYLDLARLRP